MLDDLARDSTPRGPCHLCILYHFPTHTHAYTLLQLPTVPPPQHTGH